jgi:hypothetical protein
MDIQKEKPQFENLLQTDVLTDPGPSLDRQGDRLCTAIEKDRSMPLPFRAIVR